MKQVLTLLLCAAALPALEAPASPEPTLSISDELVLEGSLAAGVARFEVTLSAPHGLPAPVTVEWVTRGLTALSGSDYAAASGTLVFEAARSVEIEVRVVPDQVQEGSEVFFVELLTPVNATLDKGLGQGVIADDDGGVRPARCDLDGDGRSNLLAFHDVPPATPDPLGHGIKHVDWDLHGPLATRGPHDVHYDGSEYQESWSPVAMHDFDGDRTCDLFWRDGSLLAVTFTTQQGPLLAPHPANVLASPHPGPDWRLVGSGHFDGDQRADLVWWNPSTRVLRVWLWIPDTDPQAFSIHDLAVEDVPAVAGSDPVAVLDPNLAVQEHTRVLWRHPGSGGLVSWRMDGLAFGEASTVPHPSGSRVDLSWRPAAVGDFDGDGHEDLVWQQETEAGAANGKLAVWFLTGATEVRETSLSPEIFSMARYLDGLIDGPR